MSEEQQNQEQQPVSSVTVDQFNQERNRDMLRNRAADDYPDEEDGDGDGEEEGRSEDVPQEEVKKPASIQTYLIFGCFAFLIDVIIDLVGAFIFTAPITFALGILFKVPAYFILTSGGRREKLVAKRVVMIVCAILGFLPGDNLAAVCVSCFIDYKDKITRNVGKVAVLAGRKDIAMAAKVLEKGSGLMDRARELDQRDREQQVQGGGRWRPSQFAGSSKFPGVVAEGKRGVSASAEKFESSQVDGPYQKRTDSHKQRMDSIPDDAEYNGPDYQGYMNARARTRLARSREEYEEGKVQFEANDARAGQLQETTKALRNRDGWLQSKPADDDMKKAA